MNPVSQSDVSGSMPPAPANPSSDLSGKTRTAVAEATKDHQAGLILGSPEFMRC